MTEQEVPQDDLEFNADIDTGAPDLPVMEAPSEPLEEGVEGEAGVEEVPDPEAANEGQVPPDAEPDLEEDAADIAAARQVQENIENGDDELISFDDAEIIVPSISPKLVLKLEEAFGADFILVYEEDMDGDENTVHLFKKSEHEGGDATGTGITVTQLHNGNYKTRFEYDYRTAEEIKKGALTNSKGSDEYTERDEEYIRIHVANFIKKMERLKSI